MNPVLRKDLLGLFRLKRVAAIQVVFVAVLALLVMATWPQGGIVGTGAGTAPAGSLIRTDDRLLVGLIVGQIVMMILFVPAIAGVALSGEKEGNTLEMLYASRLSPLEIISGKMGLAVAFPALLLISGLPFLALLNWRGDVRASDLLWGAARLAVSAVFLSMLALTISAFCQRSASSLVIAYVTVLILCGVTLVPAAIMLEHQSGIAATLMHYVRGISPVAAALSRFRGGYIDVGPARRMVPIWEVFLPASTLFTVACAALLIFRLRRPPAEEQGLGGGAGDYERSLGRRVIYLLDEKKKRRPIGPMNPVFAREQRTASVGSGRWMIRVFYGTIVLSLALSGMAIYGGMEYPDLLRHVAGILVAFQIGLIGLVTPSLTSSSISSELENGTFEMLRMTRLSGGQIFRGKFLASLFPALLPMIALIPAYGALAYMNAGYIAHFRALAPILLLAIAFCLTLGLFCSVFIPRTSHATVVAYLITASLFILPLFAWWGIGEQIPERVGDWTAFASPLVMGLTALPDSDPSLAAMHNPHLYLMGCLCVLLMIAARIRLQMLLRHGSEQPT